MYTNFDVIFFLFIHFGALFYFDVFLSTTICKILNAQPINIFPPIELCSFILVSVSFSLSDPLYPSDFICLVRVEMLQKFTLLKAFLYSEQYPRSNLYYTIMYILLLCKQFFSLKQTPDSHGTQKATICPNASELCIVIS